MPKYSISTSAYATGPRWRIHRHDCADIARELTRGRVLVVNEVYANDPETLIENELEYTQVDGWTKDDYLILPCVARCQQKSEGPTDQ